MIDVDVALAAVKKELIHARSVYPAFANYHEGHSVILEEMDELWEEIKKKPRRRSRKKLAKEAKQLAAMATRFLVDLGDIGGLE